MLVGKTLGGTNVRDSLGIEQSIRVSELDLSRLNSAYHRRETATEAEDGTYNYAVLNCLTKLLAALPLEAKSISHAIPPSPRGTHFTLESTLNYAAN